MARFGPKLDREQLLLSRFVGIATELFGISATCSFAQHKIDNGEPSDEILSVTKLLLPLRQNSDREPLRRHGTQRRQARLRAHTGASCRQT